ncbi:hypothetical protein BTR14_11275 [Rhizobium rhizosphaerae]|uniref:Uncharacterized protein n=1 Tax=Xaviernesmea rhizosphaerae TaxID=1672749 RepID=A0ABX3PDV2_9HYPH|nr:hypothetical protein [Xaviernesmea rhizosphaerae]OQP86269.1 hypothetical protein BTR14_11275 [Xaviernesmea rhizosphaerae]
MDRHAVDLWWWTVAVLLGLFVATSVLCWFDGRQIDGASVWAKPIKFQLSLALHFATLAAVASCLGQAWRDGAFLWWVAVAAVACTAFEVGYIMLQAARQQPSHFNVGAPLYATLYAMMAAGAVVLTVVAGIVGLVVLLDRAAAFDQATRLGTGLGLILGTVLTLIVAFRMGGALSHHVGTELPGAARMPLTGWSLSVGDRRVPHFFATHLMQAGPLAGLAAGSLLPRGPALAVTLVVLAAGTALTLWTFARANAGLPILRIF